MADKKIEMSISLPIDQCYISLREIGNRIRGWRSIEADNQKYILKWTHGGGLSLIDTVVTTVVLKAVSESETEVILAAHHHGLIDPFGILNSALHSLMEPFQQHLATLRELKTQIDKGLLCPTCGKELLVGTRFCPNDGTLVARECRKCGHNNPLGSQYCSNCGTQL